MFSCEYFKIFKNSFFIEYIWTSASDGCQIFIRKATLVELDHEKQKYDTILGCTNIITVISKGI